VVDGFLSAGDGLQFFRRLNLCASAGDGLALNQLAIGDGENEKRLGLVSDAVPYSNTLSIIQST